MSALLWNARVPLIVLARPGARNLGLGAYSGMDKLNNPLTKEIVARKGATDSESLEAYGKIGGAAGGAGACVALGVTAPVAGGCAILGGIIGGWIGKNIPVAKGSTMEDLVSETWNDFTAPRAKRAAKAILAVKSYLTLRDLAITQGASDAALTEAGLPPAPIYSIWAPSASRYAAAKAYDSYEVTKTALDECAVAKSLGIVSDKLTCKDYVWLTYFNGNFGPIGKPGDPIDWFAVGRSENAASWYQNKGGCPAGFFNIFDPNSASNMAGEEPLCLTELPSKAMEPLIEKLKATVNFKDVPAGATGGGGGGGSSIAPLAIGAAIVGLVAWALL
jgi:hypothetical protein